LHAVLGGGVVDRHQVDHPLSRRRGVLGGALAFLADLAVLPDHRAGRHQQRHGQQRRGRRGDGLQRWSQPGSGGRGGRLVGTIVAGANIGLGRRCLLGLQLAAQLFGAGAGGLGPGLGGRRLVLGGARELVVGAVRHRTSSRWSRSVGNLG